MEVISNSPTALVVAAAALGVAIVLARALGAVVEALIVKKLKGGGAEATTNLQDQQLLIDMATTASNVKEVRDDVAEMKKTLVQVGDNFTALTKLTAVHDYRLDAIDARLHALERRVYGGEAGR